MKPKASLPQQTKKANGTVKPMMTLPLKQTGEAHGETEIAFAGRTTGDESPIEIDRANVPL